MKKRLFGLTVLAVLLVVFIGGCNLFGPGFEETTIAGTGVNGAWTFDHGTCSQNSDGTYSIDLYPASGSDYILFSAPSSAEPEQLQFNLLDLASAKTVTYWDGSTNVIMIDGYRQVTVDSTAGTAVVRLNVSSDNYNFNGTVTLDVTP